MKITPESDTMMINAILFHSKMFPDTFSNASSFTRLRNMLWKGVEFFPNCRFLRERWLEIPRDFKESIKTGRLPATPGYLTGLLTMSIMGQK